MALRIEMVVSISYMYVPNKNVQIHKNESSDEQRLVSLLDCFFDPPTHWEINWIIEIIEVFIHYCDKDNSFVIVIIVNFQILMYTKQNMQE